MIFFLLKKLKEQEDKADLILGLLLFRFFDLKMGEDNLKRLTNGISSSKLKKLIGTYKKSFENYDLDYSIIMEKMVKKIPEEEFKAILNEVINIKTSEELKDVVETVEDKRFPLTRRNLNFKKVEGFLGKILGLASKNRTVYFPFERSGNLPAVLKDEDSKIYVEVFHKNYYLRVVLNVLLSGKKSVAIRCSNPLLNPSFVEKQKLKKFGLVLSNLSEYDRAKYFIESPHKKFGEAPDVHRSRPVFMYLNYIIEAIEDDGIGGVILPLGALSRGGRDVLFRKEIVEKKIVDTVIEIPPEWIKNTFAKYSIIILNKNKKTDDILFVRLDEKIKTNFEEIYKNRKTVKGISSVVKLSSITGPQSQYSLLPERYIEDRHYTRSLDEIAEEIAETKAKLFELDKQISKGIEGVKSRRYY